MNKFGTSIIINSKDVEKKINSKIKLSEITNEKKYVNESGDTIEYLKIKNDPVDDLDAVNLKYLTQIKSDIEKIKSDIEKLKSQVKNESDKIKQVQQAITEFKQAITKFSEAITEFKQAITKENEIFKNGVDVLVKQIKSQIDKIKGDVARHTVGVLTDFKNELKQENVKKIDFENHIKNFNLLDKNITIWYDKVEKRFNEINLPEKKIIPIKLATNEEVILEKIKGKILKEEHISNFILTKGWEKFMKKRYAFSDKELEIYVKWMESKLKTK